MKKITTIISLLVLCLWACNDNTITETYTYKVNEPVLVSKKVLRSETIEISSTPQKIAKQGKICFYEGYLYISEPGKGIHIIDNRNPSNPRNIGFVEMKGNADIAVRNNKLYADSYIDLIWFDISNPATPQFINRLEDAFPESYPVADNTYGYHYRNSPDSVIVGWELTEKTVTYTYTPCKDCDYIYAESSTGESNGLNGSMS